MRSVQTDAYRALIDALKDARLAAGLTQQHVADRLKRPQSFVAKYESGERRLDVAEFVAIAKLVGLNPSRLIAQLFK